MFRVDAIGKGKVVFSHNHPKLVFVAVPTGGTHVIPLWIVRAKRWHMTTPRRNVKKWDVDFAQMMNFSAKYVVEQGVVVTII